MLQEVSEKGWDDLYDCFVEARDDAAGTMVAWSTNATGDVITESLPQVPEPPKVQVDPKTLHAVHSLRPSRQ